MLPEDVQSACILLWGKLLCLNLSKFSVEILALIGVALMVTLIIVNVVFYIKAVSNYRSGAYFQITQIPFCSMRSDLGRYGEYLIYEELRCFEEEGAKFLFNVYIPKGNDEFAEIDVLMIGRKGIFVFESKNYSGWIFGTENQRIWYQTLPAGKGKLHKEQFYNPIMQNRSHIKHLQAFLGKKILTHSIIVFSKRCTFKSVSVQSEDVSIVKQESILYAILNGCKRVTSDVLTEADIEALYNKLYPCAQVEQEKRMKHIRNVRNHRSGM